MSTSLMTTRRFAPLFWCQFFAAFNDNFLKTALVFLILFGTSGAGAEALITTASAIFIAPYFFLSALGGELADRYDKARVAQGLKFAEIFVQMIAAAGFAFFIFLAAMSFTPWFLYLTQNYPHLRANALHISKTSGHTQTLSPVPARFNPGLRRLCAVPSRARLAGALVSFIASLLLRFARKLTEGGPAGSM